MDGTELSQTVCAQHVLVSQCHFKDKYVIFNLMLEMTVFLAAVIFTLFSSEKFFCRGRKLFKNMPSVWNFAYQEWSEYSCLKKLQKRNIL
jgi:hypothetical protein